MGDRCSVAVYIRPQDLEALEKAVDDISDGLYDLEKCDTYHILYVDEMNYAGDSDWPAGIPYIVYHHPGNTYPAGGYVCTGEPNEAPLSWSSVESGDGPCIEVIGVTPDGEPIYDTAAMAYAVRVAVALAKTKRILGLAPDTQSASVS